MVPPSAITKRIGAQLHIDIENNSSLAAKEIHKLRPEYQGTDAFKKAIENRYYYLKRILRTNPQGYIDLLR